MLPSNSIFKTNEPFYVHNFSNNYDILIGRKLLKTAQSIINCKNSTVTLFDKTYKLITSKSEKKQNLYIQKTIDPIKKSPQESIKKIDFGLFRLGHLNQEETSRLKGLLNKFKNLQYEEGDNLTFTNTIKHVLNTTHNSPIYSKQYPLAQAHEIEVDNQVQEMLNQGLIRESNSPYNSPTWVVPKKTDASGKIKYRVVIDYRKLNEITIPDRYPIPNMDEILGKLGKCQYFTTIDLAKGFHQIEMDSESIPKTAFSTNSGHYEYLRMPFGLRNAPATFQRCMNNILRPLLNKHCLVYLDDIIIFSTSLTEHLNSLQLVFSKLAEANLKLQLDKCEFLKKEASFLGHIVTPNGIKPNPLKVKAIVSYPIPTKVKEIRAFLGLTGYYRKFIPNFADIAKPMTKCLKKEQK